MSTEIAQEGTFKNTNVTGTIIITSPHEHVIATCCKVLSSGKMPGGKSSPQYALFRVSNDTPSFFAGEPTTFLGWYENEEQIRKEVLEIQNAIVHGSATYTLKYSAKTKRSWTGIKIVES